MRRRSSRLRCAAGLLASPCPVPSSQRKWTATPAVGGTSRPCPPPRPRGAGGSPSQRGLSSSAIRVTASTGAQPGSDPVLAGAPLLPLNFNAIRMPAMEDSPPVELPSRLAIQLFRDKMFLPGAILDEVFDRWPGDGVRCRGNEKSASLLYRSMHLSCPLISFFVSHLFSASSPKIFRSRSVLTMYDYSIDGKPSSILAPLQS
ncbi:hypothetical protein C2845_PM08G15200 [Panicum miliaceum]|uniref:Uncharacterized protein n=1 Tax=Panicum miliaceum TaxID=4540 RepID=A0A3L6QZF3_PANMI|nr:hypothetical protein C2845_PM08G15200 [Panicum miliaceum]